MNTARRQLDSSGNQFMPMNVEGGTWDEHFINTKKLVTIGLIAFTFAMLIVFISNKSPSLGVSLVTLLFWVIGASHATRFIIFEEKMYYKMYKALQQYEVSTPAVFWDISAIDDTTEGAIITYSDSKIGVILRVDRDTITGKNPEFKEDHYDAISDFYRELMRDKYSFVQLNIMEQTGSDPRLFELDKLSRKSDNPNIQELMQRQIGYIKTISHNTLFESDYFLIYTNDLSKMDNIINEVIDDTFKLMDGAYINYSILNSKDIIELVKELYGVKYFNYTQATLDMFKMNGVSGSRPFDVSEIRYTDGTRQVIDKTNINKLNKLTSDVIKGTVKIKDVSIKDTVKVKNDIRNNNISFGDISKGYTPTQSQGSVDKSKFTKRRQAEEVDMNFDFDDDANGDRIDF